MAIKLPEFFNNFKNMSAKSRMLLFFTAIVGIVFLFYLGSRFLEGGDSSVGASKVASAPPGLQSVPGGKVSPEYYRAIKQANAQAAAQAQITGGSAVPTLINIPEEAESAKGCTICSDEMVNVADDIDQLVKTGKLSKEEGAHLAELAKNNVSVEEYSNQLNELIKQGKLTPEQARKLLDRYKKQHQVFLNAQAAAPMDALIKTGQLPLETATQLLTLQKNGIASADYNDELNRLVKEGKITPEMAAQLFAQYNQQRQAESAEKAAFAVKQLVKAGQVPQTVAAQLDSLKSKNATPDQYINTIKRFADSGQLSAQSAAKLLAQYQPEKCEISGALKALSSQAEAEVTNSIDALQSSNKITQEAATALKISQQQLVSAKDYQKLVNQYVKENKLSNQDGQMINERYQKLLSLRAETDRLAKMQCNRSSVADYTEALKSEVRSAVITPEMAANLLREYSSDMASATVTPPAPAVPGGEGFVQLQQRVQATAAAEAPAIEASQFQATAASVNNAAIEEQKQRMQQMVDAMSGQAQQLITSWQPTTMQHQENTTLADKEKQAGEAGGTGAGSSRSGSGFSSGEAPLIKAGTILFGILDTAVNSDFPDSPVMVTIIQGPYKGAKLIGKLVITTGADKTTQDKVSLRFNLMNSEQWITSKTVTAFAIDPDTARSALASKVDYHYLKRYGALFASSFISSYADAIIQAGSSTTISNAGVTTTSPPLSPRSKVAVGLGGIGKALGAATADYVNTPPTVEVNAGVGLGILFMADVTKDSGDVSVVPPPVAPPPSISATTTTTTPTPATGG